MTDCLICRTLEGRLNRFQRNHAERPGELRSQTHWDTNHEYHRLLTEENNAKANLDLARAELEKHKRTHGAE
jgi:hypothetical protein